MICVLGFAQTDANQAIDLLRFCKELGGSPNHDILLVADCATDYNLCLEAKKCAGEAFRSVTLITNSCAVRGWPQGANSLFAAASKYAHCVHEPFLFLEPDCTPLKPGWLDAIEAEYNAEPKKPFMGCVYKSDSPGLAGEFLSGISVYPPDSVFNVDAAPKSAWDVTNREHMLKHGKHTDLIWNFWGTRNLSPTFVEAKTPQTPINAFTLADIPPKAVLQHRCKNGTLIQLLRKKLFPPAPAQLLCVLPMCGADIEAAIRNVAWMEELGQTKNYPALLSVDDQTYREKVKQVEASARQAFGEVRTHYYSTNGKNGWPQGANMAWQHAARFVQANYRLPWFFCEADMVALKSSWLDELSAAYQRCGKMFFGPIVKGRGHCNGAMIYCWDAANRLPSAMKATTQAWDYLCKAEMLPHAADAEPLVQHAWGLHNGAPHPYEGNPIRFNSVDQVKAWVHPDAVVFHRSKYGDLQRLLREIKA